ncbi:helix-turn-helix domain-containing protein [Pseudonocardia ailaonensis]|uniref:TetR/AcrR family transcriptional regulator n=1 Tax=Pseudonocardia ailaonensis TaxID=367279 RepID=UPI0031D0C716
MRRSDARDNRERILTVARAAFAGEGLDVPIRKIARWAGLGPATVYRHFPSKKDLLAAAFAESMATCSTIVEEGLAAADPWDGFCRVVERLMEVHALDRGFSRAFTSRVPKTTTWFAEGRDRTLRLTLELVRRAKDPGDLRDDFVLEDIVLALMANSGIRAESPAAGAAASRRLTAFMISSFRTEPEPAPLPPPARLLLAPR